MTRDLGAGTREVHDGIRQAAREVLGFWFHDTPDERRWAKDAAFDAEIARRFGALHAHLLATRAAGWTDDLAPLLAAIVVLDQFSRNMFRGQGQAFAADALALSLTRIALANGWERLYNEEERQFLYLPLMHAEDAATQAESVARFATLADPKPLAFARDHAAVIERYGRFPSRNAALGRESTVEEREYLSRPDAGW